MVVRRLYCVKEDSSETGQSKFPCRRQLPLPPAFSQYEALLPKRQEKQKLVLLYFEPKHYLITCVKCFSQHCMEGCINSFDTRGIADTRKISLGVHCGLVQA